MKIGDKVKVISGEFTGYYGTVLELTDVDALVSHNDIFEGYHFEGYRVDLNDLEVCE